ncbi:MAG: diphosphate--fructose-6-phosphate 1-phosphotransferase, partial [Muribaculaceae bacterium]|nr:diphosphate--fructose-6-phosphate 1-phosphotransferase [Muribaculaceae bacterium]
MTTTSVLQQLRASYQPKLPTALQGQLKMVMGEPTESVADQEQIEQQFPTTYGMPQITFVPCDDAPKAKGKPINVGVILSGGQAPGGHNVISGIFDGIKRIHPDSRLFGFLMGPDGLVKHNYMELTADIIDQYRNTGGFDMIGSGRTKLDKEEQFEKGLEIIRELDLKAVVIIGGDDSNTNAAIMAEYYKAHGEPVQVIGCPKTIDGDLKNEFIEASFGFDTATKVYSELIGNVERDCFSARKYWHFIKLMGRSASHIALECALQTQPNLCLISEEVEEYCLELSDIVTSITNIVVKRARRGLNFGTILVPEGLIEFIPSCKALIEQLNEIMAKFKPEVSTLDPDAQVVFIREHLEPENLATLDSLPKTLGRQLMLDRDPHGNVHVSLIETEKLLSTLVKKKLKQINKG